MSLDALRAGIRWEFESFPQYLDMLQRQGVGPNVACFAGHSAIRTFVMGEEATERTATRRRDRRDDGAGARGDGGRRRRLRHLDRRGAQRRRRHAHALAPGRRPRTARAGAADGRERPRRLHADQGQQDLDPLSRGARRRGQAAGGDRRPLPFQHQSRRRPSRRSTRSTPPARAAISSWRRPRAARSAWISPSRARTCSRACSRGSPPWRRTTARR